MSIRARPIGILACSVEGAALCYRTIASDAKKIDGSLQSSTNWSKVRSHREPVLRHSQEVMMSSPLPQNFTNREDDKYGKLHVVDVRSEIALNEPWFNQTLTTVNDAVVRIGIFEGDFPWHKHDDQDEFFLVLEGEIFLDIEGRGTERLGRHEGYTVPKSVIHRPRSPQKSAVLMVESVGIKATGD